jgi:DNA-binding GntR family transcriptional regulator
LPPRRDAFALALDALRRRLRQGVDAPGDALPINLIAAELRLSSTPVREALSRLAGERLVDKRGPAYTRPRMDGPALAALYGLRLIHLLAALAPEVEPRRVRQSAPRRAPLTFARDLASGASPTAFVEALFLGLVRDADDPILVQAYQPIADRLAPFQGLEARGLGDVAQEALGLISAFEADDTKALRSGLRRYHRQRMAQSHALVRLAEREKYRTDIV